MVWSKQYFVRGHVNLERNLQGKDLGGKKYSYGENSRKSKNYFQEKYFQLKNPLQVENTEKYSVEEIIFTSENVVVGKRFRGNNASW